MWDKETVDGEFCMHVYMQKTERPQTHSGLLTHLGKALLRFLVVYLCLPLTSMFSDSYQEVPSALSAKNGPQQALDTCQGFKAASGGQGKFMSQLSASSTRLLCHTQRKQMFVRYFLCVQHYSKHIQSSFLLINSLDSSM